ncbi:MAG: VOC family protein [Acidobacteria bacterium]|nr:VOC family protein [Acidobacteriota bacterium]
MPRVIHFEISADEAERALKFYSEVFDWKTQKWEGPEDYWLVMTGEGGPGINGGLYRRHEGMSFNTHVNTIDVPSVEDYLARVEAAGGKRVTGKITLPGVGYLAYCQDTEGNTFGIMQADSAAAA